MTLTLDRDSVKPVTFASRQALAAFRPADDPEGPSLADRLFDAGYNARRHGGRRTAPDGIGAVADAMWKTGYDARVAEEKVRARAEALEELRRAEALDEMDADEAERLAEEAEWQASYEAGYCHA